MNFTSAFTPLGQQLSAKLHAGASLSITRVVAGAGQTPAAATALSNPKQTLTLRPMERSGSIVSLPVTLVSVQAESAYSLTELGVYAQDPDLGEILYKLYTLTTPISVAPTAQMVLRFHLKDVVTVGTGASVSVSPAGLVTETDFAPLRDRVLATEVPTKSYTMDVTALPAFLDSLPRLLTETLEITLSGTLTTALNLRGFYGNGTIVLRAATRGGCVLQRGIFSYNNLLYTIQLVNLTINPSYLGGGHCVYCDSSSILFLNACNVVGDKKSVGIWATDNAVVTAADCDISENLTALLCERASTISVSNPRTGPVYGNNGVGVHVREGGVVLLNRNVPNFLGGSTHEHDGGIIAIFNGTLI